MSTYTAPAARTGANWTPGFRKGSEIAADIRRDLKAAQKAGDIPADVKVSVRTRTYAGGRAIDVTLTGWDRERIYTTDWFMTPEAQAVRQTVETIRESYNRDASDSMVDYFDVDYYGSTDWR
jgi:hypothetical protein